MAQFTPIRGFANTPVTKSICIVSAVLPLVLSILSIKYVVHLIINPYIIQYYQIWRILTYQLSVVSESDFLLSTLIWFQFKVLERFYGSRKYLSVVTLFAIYNAIGCFLLMSIGQLVTRYSFFFIKVFILRFDRKHVDYETSLLNEVAPGPVGIISSLYVLYAVNIPTSYYFKILLQKPKGLEERREEVGGGGGGGEEDEGGESFKARSNKNSSRELTLSNQFPVHTLFILLLLNNGFKSLIPAVVGLLIGKLYAYDLLPGGTSWFVPKFIFQLFINPRRKLLQSLQLIHQRIFNPRYQPLTISESTDPSAIRMNSEEPEDNDDLLDETRRQESQIRAETPVRPLGSQFLDTFRT